MKRALLLGFGLALGAAAPAQAADHVVQAQASLTWDQPDITIPVGDSVTWQFTDTSQNHNVQSQARDTADADWNSFASPIAVGAPPISHTFNAEGTYTYVCVVHTSTMTGVVRVGSAGPPPPPPLSAQKFNNDDASVFPAETVSLDKSKPRLSSLSARRSGHGGARFRFRVSEESVVDVRLKRGGRTYKRFAAAGKGTLAFTAKKLKAGKYRVEVRAYDVAGNASSLKRVSLTVR